MGKAMLALRFSIVILSVIGLIACTKVIVHGDSTDDKKNQYAVDKSKLFYRGTTPPTSLEEYEKDFDAFVADVRKQLLTDQAQLNQIIAEKTQDDQQVAHHQADEVLGEDGPENEPLLNDLLLDENSADEMDIIIDEKLLAQEGGIIGDDLFISEVSRDDDDIIDDRLVEHTLNDDGTLAEEFEPLALLAMLENKSEDILYETVQANYYHYLGWERAGLGDYTNAIENFKRALYYEPENAIAYNSIGLARVSLGDVDGAIQEYSSAININPYYPSAFHNRGKARAALGDYDGAVEDYRKALQLNVNVGLLYLDRATAEYMRGNHAKALDDVQKALELGAENTDTLMDKIQNQQL